MSSSSSSSPLASAVVEQGLPRGVKQSAEVLAKEKDMEEPIASVGKPEPQKGMPQKRRRKTLPTDGDTEASNATSLLRASETALEAPAANNSTVENSAALKRAREAQRRAYQKVAKLSKGKHGATLDKLKAAKATLKERSKAFNALNLF